MSSVIMIIFVKVNFKNGLNVNNNGSLQNKPKKFNYLNFREGGGSKIRPKLNFFKIVFKNTFQAILREGVNKKNYHVSHFKK